MLEILTFCEIENIKPTKTLNRYILVNLAPVFGVHNVASISGWPLRITLTFFFLNCYTYEEEAKGSIKNGQFSDTRHNWAHMTQEPDQTKHFVAGSGGYRGGRSPPHPPPTPLCQETQTKLLR